MNQDEPVVCVIDDDASVRKSLAMLFETAALPTRMFASAEEFLAADLRDRAGCLVLDLRMPGMGGVELLKRLHAARSRLPVIVISGHADVPTTVHTVKYGAIDVLEKPFDPAALMEAVRGVLVRRADDLRHADAGTTATSPLAERGLSVIAAIAAGKADAQIAAELDVPIEVPIEVPASVRSQFNVKAGGVDLDGSSQLLGAPHSPTDTPWRNQWLANVSHEMRTPLTAIMGYAEMMTDAGLSDAERQRRAHTISLSAQRLLHVVTDMLDFAKIDAGKLKLQRAATDPRRIVSEVISLLRQQADAKGLTLESIIAVDAPSSMETDANRLWQILVNLIGNALKFTKRGGVRVSLFAHVAEGGNERPTLHFEVADTGIGLTSAEMSALFQPFARVERNGVLPAGGTGLGLFISRRLAQLMEGDIRVMSEIGQGSRFTLTLPIDAGLTVPR